MYVRAWQERPKSSIVPQSSDHKRACKPNQLSNLITIRACDRPMTPMNRTSFVGRPVGKVDSRTF